MSFLGFSVSARTVRWLALGYALKAMLLALVWLVAPELSAQAIEQARAAVARLQTAVGTR